MSTQKRFDKQHTIHLPAAMWQQIVQACQRRQPPIRANEWIREALRAHLEQDVDQIGSRRHFQRSLQQAVADLEHTLQRTFTHYADLHTSYFHVLLQLEAFALTTILTSLLNRKVEPGQLIGKALSDAAREQADLEQQIRQLKATDDKPSDKDNYLK